MGVSRGRGVLSGRIGSIPAFGPMGESGRSSWMYLFTLFGSISATHQGSPHSRTAGMPGFPGDKSFVCLCIPDLMNMCCN